MDVHIATPGCVVVVLFIFCCCCGGGGGGGGIVKFVNVELVNLELVVVKVLFPSLLNERAMISNDPALFLSVMDCSVDPVVVHDGQRVQRMFPTLATTTKDNETKRRWESDD